MYVFVCRLLAPLHNRFTALFLGPSGWAGARRELLDFMVQAKINRGRHTDHPARRHSIRTNQCPPPPSSPYFYRPFPGKLQEVIGCVLRARTCGSAWSAGLSAAADTSRVTRTATSRRRRTRTQWSWAAAECGITLATTTSIDWCRTKPTASWWRWMNRVLANRRRRLMLLTWRLPCLSAAAVISSTL